MNLKKQLLAAFDIFTAKLRLRRGLGAAILAFLAAPSCLMAGGGPVSSELTWTIENTTVAATVSVPDGAGPHPALVFIPGSGPTDRNWTSPLLPGTNGSAALLAEELAKTGFVVLRYDKRFTGPYAAGNMRFLAGKLSFQSHIDEVSGAVARLKERGDVDPARIFALTNSEGAIHAFNYQLQAKGLAGMVLTGAPGRALVDVMHGQIAAQVAALPDAKSIMAGYDKLMKNFLDGTPFAADPALPAGINSMIGNFYNPMGLPFTRELLTTDPARLFALQTAPALVVIGRKDIQIDWQMDGGLLEKAAKGQKNKTFLYPENANHVLKFEAKPRAELTAKDGLGYNAAGKILDAETVKAIKAWLLEQTAVKSPGSVP